MKRICLLHMKLTSLEKRGESIASPSDKIHLHLYEQELSALLSVFSNLQSFKVTGRN